MLDMGFIPDVERIVADAAAATGRRCSSAPPWRREIQPAGRRLPAEPEGDRGRRARPRSRRPSTQGSSPSSPKTTSARRCAELIRSRGRAERADLLQPQDATSISSTSRCNGTVSASARCMATWRNRRVSPTLEKFKAGELPACWSAATSRRAGSTSAACQPCLQLRRAASCRGLRPPHRPHRPRGPDRPRLHPGDARRARNGGGDREADRCADPAYRHRRRRPLEWAEGSGDRRRGRGRGGDKGKSAEKGRGERGRGRGGAKPAAPQPEPLAAIEANAPILLPEEVVAVEETGRGGGRRRGGQGRDGHPPRERLAREVQALEESAQAAPEAQPRQRNERKRGQGQVPAEVVRAKPEETQREPQGRRDNNRRPAPVAADREAGPVLGFGAEIPAFMLIRPRRRAPEPAQIAAAGTSDHANAAPEAS